MRALFLTPQLPSPPRQGTQIRNYHLIRAAAAAHQVDLLSFVRTGEDLHLGHPLLDICRLVKTVPAPHRGRWSRLRTLATSSEPDLAQRLASRDYAATLRSMLRANSYDVVQVEGLEMAGYIPTIKAESPNSAVVFDDHNVEHLLQARAAAVDARRLPAWPRALYSVIQWQKLKRYESWACVHANAVLAVSEADARALRGLGITAPVTVVPNCIDVQHYRRPPDVDRDPATLLFTGTMDYRPNVDAVRWFVSAVLPRVLARRPEVGFHVVGRSPAPSVLELGRKHPSVQVAGTVEDVRPYFSKSTVFVAPIRMAGGARLKILEALAMELPVVATSVGAEGIDLVSGKEILLADTADAFAAAVLRLLDDPAVGRQLAIAGRRAVEQRYHRSRLAPRLLRVYDAIKVASDGIEQGETP